MNSESGLPKGWEARLGLNGRIYYYSKRSHIVQILPPPEIWRCKYCLPYGWEMAVDYDNKRYYINHVTQAVTYEDPRTEDDQTIPLQQQKQGNLPLPPPDLLLNPQPREYTVDRDPHMGFGFIAGSEKPVIVRSVTAGGPSEGKLLPDDQILKIGAENVLQAERERVIQLIRDEADQVSLTVLQPNRSANSSFLNPAKKTFKSMDRPKVRFADDVVVNDQCRVEGSSPLLVSPGVLRVELENKQTRSFRFDPDTTAGDAVAALCHELGFKDPNFFSLVIASPAETDDEHGSDKSAKSSFSSTTSEHSLMSSSSPDSILLAPWDSLSKVVNNPAVRHHCCYLRLEFMPRDFPKLARTDPEAFQYLYVQCVNDVVSGDRYKNDLTHEDFVKLAVLQMQELVMSSIPSTPPEKRPSSSGSSESSFQKNAFRFPGLTNKLTLKYFEKEYGLRRFLPSSVLDAMKKDNATAKNIKKLIQQYLKASYSTPIFNQQPTSPIIPTSPILISGGNAHTALFQLRLQYLKILSPQHLFGGRFFSASMLALMESDIAILVGHHYGISQLINAKTRMVSVLSEFQHIKGLEVAPCRAESRTTQVKIQFTAKKDLLLSMEQQDAHNFAFMVAGYCRVYGNIDMVLTLPMAEATTAPVYFGPHKVKSSCWNYPTFSHLKNDSSGFPPVPSSFYCDFSEPVTPSLLSHDTPPLTNGLGNKWHPRPPTPPPKVDDIFEDDESVFVENLLECGDANNNGSNHVGTAEGDIVYEEIVTSLTESVDAADFPVQNVLTDQTHGKEVQSHDGALVPNPQSKRSARSSEIDSDDTVNEIITNGSVNEEMSSLDEQMSNSTESNDEHLSARNGYVALTSPPDYPTPRRKDSMKKGAGTIEFSKRDAAEKQTIQRIDDTLSAEGTQQELHLSEFKSDPTNVSEDSKSLESFHDVVDPATIRKLQETEDLIQYFRQKHQEIVGESGDGAMSSATGNFVSPIVVSDLAAGNKRLRRAEKAAIKNRKSWGGIDNVDFTEDPGLMSRSTPDLSSMSKRKKQNRNIFRKFFGDRRKKPLSMYDATSSSAYGRRKRRFRMPRLRLKKAFSLNSTRKSNRKSVLPDANVNDKSTSSRFRFFSSRKTKSYGMLVISEPCDVRGVDLLPKGKYTVAGTMFNGDAREPEVITVGSKDNSVENLQEIGAMNNKPSSKSTSNVAMRSSGDSMRVSKRPVSFLTFQQMGTGHSPSDETAIGLTEEHRSNSALLSSGQLSPSELSQTESTEAIHEIAPIHSIMKPPRKLIAVANPVLPDTTSKSQTTDDISDSRSTTQISIPANVTSTENTKRPPYKRPAPPPPIQLVKERPEPHEKDAAASTVEPAETDDGCVKVDTDSEERLLQNDSEDESRLFDPRSDDSMSLVTEIFSYLKSNNENEDAKVPELPDDKTTLESCIEEEDTLLYDQNYIMPGVRTNVVMEVERIENEPDDDEITKDQRTLCDMFYNDMIANNYKFPIDDSESLERDSDDSDVSDEHRQGSYDFTHSDDSDNTDEDVSDSGVVTLRYFAVANEHDETTQDTFPTQLSNGLDSTAEDTIGAEHSTSGIAENSEPEIEDNCLTAEKEERDSATMTETNSGRASSSGHATHASRSYFSYGNLISPPGYRKGGAKRSPLSPKPPLPPKPVFH